MTTVTIEGSSRGFSLTELLVSLTLTLTIMGGAYSALREAADASSAATASSEVNQNLRIAMNTLIRDLMQAGEGDFGLRTGISIPSGDGVDAIVRPGPAGSDWTFPATYTVLPAVTPANGFGAVVNGIATDVVTILSEDRRLDFSGVIPTIPASGASMTFPNDFAIDDASIGIKEGDLIRFSNGAMQEVTNVAGNTIHFQAAAASNLNQRTAPQGSVMELRGDQPTFPDLPISRIQMITYYIRVVDGTPQLVRRVNYGPERVVAVGIENLQLSWDLVDGINNPINQEDFADEAEGQIRKANVYMSATSRPSGPNVQPLRTSLTTQVSLRSMAFVSRYDIAP